MTPRETIPVLLLTTALVSPTAATAQTSPWTVRLGAAHVEFSPKADVQVNGAPVVGGDATASSNTTLGLELAYDITPQWTGRFLIGVPPTTTLTGAGTLASAGALGKVNYGPAALTATFNLLDAGPVRPYIGAGINYTIVFSSKDAFITNLDVKSAFGSVIEAGADFPLDGGWSIGIDARKIFVKTKADGVLPAFGGAATHADVRLNPLVLFASVGRRF